MRVKSGGMTDLQADAFLFCCLFVLLINFGSQVVSFPLQVAMIVFAVLKADVKALPGLFVVLLDKSNFPFFNAELLKFNIGISIGVQNFFLIITFLTVLWWFVNNRFSEKIVFALWLPTFIPALIIALMARRNMIPAWQEPLVAFMVPCLYFWGERLGRTWQTGSSYFVKRMAAIFSICGALRFCGQFRVFSFAIISFPVALFVCAMRMQVNWVWRGIAGVGAISAVGFTFLARYIGVKEKTGYADMAESVSSFTTAAVFGFALWLAVFVIRSRARPALVRGVPFAVIIACTLLFFYSVVRASAVSGPEVSGNYRNLFERFEYKLVGDRGKLWVESIEDAQKPPYIFRDYNQLIVEQIDYKNGGRYWGMKMPPHNQILFFLIRFGWWFGIVCCGLLFWMYFRMFNCSARLLNDNSLSVLVASSAALFFAVGLTGQSVWVAVFVGNGMASMVFPGIVSGVWLESRRSRHANIMA